MATDNSKSSGLFSSISIGRAGRSMASRASSDTIAHPLLGASTSSLAPGAGDSDNDSIHGRSPSDGSLPYKPRQRHGGAAFTASSVAPGPSPTTGSPTSHATGTSSVAPAVTSTPAIGVSAPPTTSTSTSNTFALSASNTDAPAFQMDASATSRLQLQSLKASAQKIGLGNASMGMGMIDSIFDKGARARSEGSDWADLLKVLTSGKAIILLPSSPASSLPMTPQTLRDHVAFLSPSIPVSASKSTTQEGSTVSVLVTLSGLIGTLTGTSVTFESSVPLDSPLIGALRDESRRIGVLSTLRPTEFSSNAFPSYTLSTESTTLSFPPLSKGAPILSLQPEKSDRKDKEVPRRSPFASLFGGSGRQVSSPSLGSPSKAGGGLSPERPLSPSPGASGLSSPLPSVVSLEPLESTTSPPELGEGYNVQAFTINKPVRYTEIHKALVKAVRSTVRQELEGLPDKVADKTMKLVVASVCPVGTGSSVDQALLKSHHHGLGSADEGNVPLDFSDPTGVGERLQDFMEAVYDDLIVYYQSQESPNSRRRGSDHDHVEHLASEGTERVEGLVCRLLYNRIYSPIHSDDARHDEALASRIAALNMLDLSLDHLGLITRPPNEPVKGAIAKGLASLVGEIGLELQKLSTLACLTPKEKADALVLAHKVAVDGLGRLPPIELRPEGQTYNPPPPEEEGDEDEDEDADKTLSTISEKPESTPRALEGSESASVPDLVLSQSPGNSVKSPETDLTEELEKVAEPAKPSTSGADLILPLIIYAVVKSNPSQLASHLMYLRRYRSAICLEGEASYAIVNLTAVVEFIEHVQLAELGLGDDSGKVMSVEDLAPISLNYLDDGNADTASIASASSRLRGRVFQVGELAGTAAGTANKVITGVVDSSWSTLRGFMGTPTAEVEEAPKSPIPGSRPRQASTFSLASVTASVANMAAAATTAAARTRSRASSHASERVWGGNQEMTEVASRPESVREHGLYSDSEQGGSDHEVAPTALDSDDETGSPHEDGLHRTRSDARSIMSVSSMMSREGAGSGGGTKRDASDRQAFGNRLASIGAFGRLGNTPPPPAPAALHESSAESAMPPPDAKPGSFFSALTSRGTQQPNRRPSLLAMGDAVRKSDSLRSPTPSVAPLPDHEPPVERFLTCDVGDIRLNEIGPLLRDYRRLAGIINKLQNAQGRNGTPPSQQ